MAIGRISGSVLKSNLTRNGVDLAFETNLLYLDVTNSRIGIGTSEPTTALDVSGTVKATAFTGDGSGLTGINVSTNIQIVGDDSTGAILGTGETFKIAGATGITTAVSGDTLTITGPDLTSYATTAYVDAQNTAQALTFVGDDSTGTAVNSGETFKIAGAGGVTTAVSGDTITITGPTGTLSNIVEDTTPQLGGNLDVNGNSIVSTSNGNIVLDPDGTGVIEVNGSIVPNTDLTVSLGSATKRFTDAYFGSGTVYIGDNSISSSDEGLVFSAPISVEGGLTQISDDTTATVINATKIGNSTTTVNSFDTTDYDSALYYVTTLDESNNKIEVAKISLCHDTATSYLAQSGTATSNTTSVHTYSTDISGSVRLQLAGTSAVNSMTAYQLTLGNNSSAATSGHTAVVTPGTISGSSTTAIDSWSASAYRSMKYFISVKNTDTNEVNNIEAIVLHDGTDADITTYNVVRTGTEDLCDLSVNLSGSTVTLYATPNNSQTLRVMIHKIFLADSESVVNYDNVYIIPSKTISGSSYTTIDTFEDTKINGAVYFVTSTNTTDGLYTASEVYVTTNGTESFVVHGPELAINGQIYFTSSISGNKVNLKAYTTGSSNTVINAYRIGMYRFEQGGDFAQTVTLDTAQSISGTKTFTAGVLTDTIQSPGSNADLTIDASGTGAVQILTQKVIMTNLPTSDPGVAGQLWNNAGVLNISAG